MGIIKGEENGNFNNRWSDEKKKKFSEKIKTQYKNGRLPKSGKDHYLYGKKSHIAKGVKMTCRQNLISKKFESLKDASKEAKCSVSSIHRYCNNKRKHNLYIFEYA